MMEVENGHQIVMQSFGKLMDLRDQIGYSGLADVSGDTLSFDLSKTETKAIAPAIIEIGTLAKQIENMLPDLCEEATCLRLKLGPELKAHYHFIHFVTFEPR